MHKQGVKAINLYPFQADALKATRNQNRVAYYMDMGLGKTFVGSQKLMELDARVNLVVCQKSKIQDWVEHFYLYDKEWKNGNLIYDLTNKKTLEAFLETVADRGYSQRLIGVINYELLWRRKDLKNLSGFTLLLDESSLIQNDTAKRSKYILQMNPANVILLSGTPTSGKYENLWSQIHLLGWPISKALYNRQYVNWVTLDIDGFPVRTVDKETPYKHVDRLKMKLRENGAYFLKTEECFTLPEQNMIPVSVPTIPEYRRFRKNKLVRIGDVELVGDSVLSERLYCRMLCGHYNPQKLKAFADLLESTKERLIVFYNFNAELEALKQIALELNRPISQVNGSIKDLSAYETEDDSVTLIQYQAGAMGLNLQKAHRIIYFTLTDKSELFEQSKKRIHRIGQKQLCFYYLLICKNSVEEAILKALEQRRDFTDELFKESEV